VVGADVMSNPPFVEDYLDCSSPIRPFHVKYSRSNCFGAVDNALAHVFLIARHFHFESEI
jgi:hypothetical protein